jgi:hypothetical protein
LVVRRWLAQFLVEDIHLKEDRIQRIADFMGQGTREAPEHGELRIASEACFQEGHLSYDDHHPSFNAMEVEHLRALYMYVHESAIAPLEPQPLTEGGQAVVGLPQEMVHDFPWVKDLYQPHGIDLLQCVTGEAFGVRIP